MIVAENSQASEWGLTPDLRERLESDPEIVAAICRARRRFPLPAGYTPRTIEIVFDDVVCARITNGVLVYERRLPAGYVPPFIEYRLDGQMGWFQIQGKVLVDRLSKLAALDQLLQTTSTRLISQQEQEDE